jgi:hypothetical protein
MSAIANTTSVLGKGFPRLSGTDNYNQWMTAFEPIARLNGVWEFFIAGDKPGFIAPITKPRITFPSGTDAATRSKTAEFQYELELYKFNLEEWKDNEKRVRFALALLQASIEPYVWSHVEDLPKVKTHPREAIKAIQLQNTPSQASVIQQNALALSALRLDACDNNIREYIHQANTLHRGITQSNGTYPYGQLISSILNGLPARLSTFKDLTLYMKQLDSYDASSYDTFTKNLIQYADEHKPTQNKGSGSNNKTKGGSNNAGNGSNGAVKDKRTCHFCGIKGHIETDCRKKKKAIIDQGTDTPTKPSPPPSHDNPNNTSSNKGKSNKVKPDDKPHTSALATSNNNDYDSDDDFGHVAGVSICDDYIRHSDPPSMLPRSLSPLTADSLQSNFDGRSSTVEVGKEMGEAENETDWEALSLHEAHRSNQAIALLGEEHKSVPKDEWAGDTGATTHICNDRTMFTSLTNRKSKIGSCDSTATLMVYGYGPVNLTFITPSGKHATATLTNVSYAPNSRCNLISIPRLADKANISFRGDRTQLVLINDKGREFAFAPRKHRLYCFQLKLQTSALTLAPPTIARVDIAAAAVDFEDKVWKKHRELGHLSIEGMRKLNKIADGLGLSDQELKAKLLDICPVCATSKALNRIPREPARRHFKAPGDLIHIDIWGPYPIPGLKGERYCIFYTDDATRYTWLDFLISRDGLGLIVRNRLKQIQKTHGFELRRIRSDNELVQKVINELVKEEGITHEIAVPYAHWQNGVSERTNRTVREINSAQIQDHSPSPLIAAIIGRTTESLRSATIPEGLWTEGMTEAVWKKNRSPTKALKFKKTPFEALTGLRPDLSNERAWGSRVYVKIPLEKYTTKNFTKLHTPRAYLAYFVATESESTIRVWDPEREKVSRVSASRVDSSAGMNDSQPGQDLNSRLPETPILSENNVENDNDSADDDSEIAAVSIDTHSTYYDDESDIPEDATVLSHHFRIDPSLDTEDETNESINMHSETDESTQGIIRHPTKLRVRSANDIIRIAMESVIFQRCKAHPNETTRETYNAIQPHPAISTQPERTVKDKIRLMRKNHVNPTRTTYDLTYSEFSFMSNDELLDHLEAQHIPIPHNLQDAFTALALIKTYGRDTKFTDKCYFCYTTGKSCKDHDEQGCKLCKQNRRNCRTLEDVMTDRCTSCKNYHYQCDATRPCRTCVRHNHECHDYDKSTGTMTRHWTSEDTPPEDLDDCDRCLRLKRNCGGYKGFPCYTCNAKREKLVGRSICSFSNIGNNKGKAFLLKAFKYEEIDEDWVCTPQEFEHDEADISSLARSFQNTGRCKKRDAKSKEKAATNKDINNLENDKIDSDLDSDTDKDTTNAERTQVEEDSDYGDQDLNDDDLRSLTGPMDTDNSDDVQEGSDYDGQDLDDDDLYGLAMVSTDVSSSTRYAEEDPVDSDIHFYNKGQDEQEDELYFDITNYAMLISSGYLGKLPRNYTEAMKFPDAEKYHEATMKEFKQLERLGVFEVVPLPPGKKALSTKLVYKKKYRPTGEVKKYKARCVARGFLQKKGQDYEESWAGTANSTAIRVLIALAIAYGWSRHQVDIMTAFLHALLHEETYARPPPPIQLPKGFVWKLKRALYGLVQSPRAWFRRLKDEMIKLGFRQSPYEPCIYIHNSRRLIISVVVDDLSIFTPEDCHAIWFKHELSRIFNITDEDEDCTYLGMQINCTRDKVSLHQSVYANKIIERFDLNGLAPAKIPAKPSVKLTKNATEKTDAARRTLYLEKFGSLNYLPTMTRPDLAYSLSICGRYMANPTQEHMDAIDNIYAYVKATPHMSISYKKQEPFLEGYVDADWVGCLDSRRSTTGYVFTIAGGPVSWSSKRQNIVALSTTEAEYIAAGEAVKEALWLKRFINDLAFEGYHIQSVPLHVDNQSAIALMKNPIAHQRTKHIDARHHFIRDVIEDGDVTIKWISGKDNIADMFTKALPKANFDEFKEKLNMRQVPHQGKDE